MDLGIKNKRVLITGGSKGIGYEIARLFANEGCKVSIVARNKVKLRKLVNKIGGKGQGHNFCSQDLRKKNAVKIALREMDYTKKHFDIVIHNVGGGLGIKDPLSKINDWLDVWMFNVGIAIQINNMLIPRMLKRKWGRIVHISSISAIDGGPTLKPYGGSPPYSAAKAYLNTYIKSLGKELAKNNIVVTGIMPGAILAKGKHWERMKKKNPLLVNQYLKNNYAINRFAQPKEIAPFAVFLASQQASFASTSILSLDGGKL